MSTKMMQTMCESEWKGIGRQLFQIPKYNNEFFNSLLGEDDGKYIQEEINKKFLQHIN